jgi:probable O-glycosylation ligase (exosortase A-associated)
MRDLFVTMVVFGSLPLILARPWIGIIMWSWLGYMNPHRLTWGFAYAMPFAQIVALTTLAAMLFSKEKKKLTWSPEITVLTLFILWMLITTYFALEPDAALEQLDKVLKIQLMTYVTLILMASKERIEALIWTIALSLGFYGVKGGIFTVLTGGSYHVLGPEGSFIAGNNETGLALLMTMPLVRYLQLRARRRWVKLGLTAALVLIFIAVLGTQSRGAYVGAILTGSFLLLKSRKRFALILLAALAVPPALLMMPETWWERMGTIQNYEEDRSAMGRINAWRFATNLALERPTGGGFETFRAQWFRLYAPIPGDVHDAHSIWFEVLGEHGFVGLGLFLALGFMTWRRAGGIVRLARDRPDLAWASDLARMIQVSLVAYASAGSFLGLAYFDLYYHLIAVTVIVAALVKKAVAEPAAERVTAPRHGPEGLGIVRS